MAKVIGVGNVIRNISIESELLKLRVYKGMVVSAVKLEKRMDEVRPLVPIDTKAMRDSWFIRGKETRNLMRVAAGYQSWYAPFVHEKTGAINWTRPGSDAKWLQIHFASTVEEMKSTISEYASKGKFGVTAKDGLIGFQLPKIQEEQTHMGYTYKF